MVNDNADIISSLISFLQENDPKFKDFELVNNIKLCINFNENEEKVFYQILIECVNLPINNIPNVEDFRKILIQKGADKNKFTINIINNLLKAVIFEFKTNCSLGFIAYIIYNKTI